MASFGNSRLDNLLDWVQIKTNFNPTVSEVKQGAQYLTMITVIALSDESDDLNWGLKQKWIHCHVSDLQEAPSCSIPLSLHLEIKWTNYGSFVNPQAQIVSIKEVIQSNTSSLVRHHFCRSIDSRKKLQAERIICTVCILIQTLLSRGSSVLPIRSSVAFIPVSAAALPGYRATPTINAKLPFDFFFPFVWSNCSFHLFKLPHKHWYSVWSSLVLLLDHQSATVYCVNNVHLSFPFFIIKFNTWFHIRFSVLEINGLNLF